jgi:hypothetical protein
MGFLGVQLLKHSELQDSSRGTALVHRSAAIVVLVIIVLIKEAGLSEPGLLLPLQLASDASRRIAAFSNSSMIGATPLPSLSLPSLTTSLRTTIDDDDSLWLILRRTGLVLTERIAGTVEHALQSRIAGARLFSTVQCRHGLFDETLHHGDQDREVLRGSMLQADLPRREVGLTVLDQTWAQQ